MLLLDEGLLFCRTVERLNWTFNKTKEQQTTYSRMKHEQKYDSHMRNWTPSHWIAKRKPKIKCTYQIFISTTSLLFFNRVELDERNMKNPWDPQGWQLKEKEKFFKFCFLFQSSCDLNLNFMDGNWNNQTLSLTVGFYHSAWTILYIFEVFNMLENIK